MTMTLVQTITVGSGGAASIEFTGVTAGADDLLVVVSARSSNASVEADLFLEFNNDTGNNYSYRRLIGSGSSASSDSTSGTNIIRAGSMGGSTSTASTFSSNAIYIPNYAGSAAKSVSVDAVMENNSTTAFSFINAGLWNSTSAITSIKLSTIGNLVQYSTASLYKITKA